MTLKDYYYAIPQRNSPRYDFLKRIADRCAVSVTTARNWCIYGIKPTKYAHVKVLIEETGIQEEQLWEK